MPMGTPATDLASQLVYEINELIEGGIKPIKIKSNFYKIELEGQIYYWYEKNGKILLGAQFEKSRKALRVNFIAKVNKGKPTYASDLYNDVLDDRKNIKGINSIVMSDDKLSEEGLKIWKKLFDNGHKVLVYDVDNPGQSYVTLHNVDDLDNYFRMNDPSYKRYRYVLSEGLHYLDTRTAFHLRRLRETSGLL